MPRDRHRAQPGAGARAAEAEPVADAEQRAMGGAEDVPSVAIEEAVGLPVERRAAMRAGIGIGEHRLAAADQEEAEASGVLAEPEPLAAAIGDVGEAAEERAGRRRLPAAAHGLTPAILHRSRHSAAPTATTERRDWRTSPSSARRGSALTCWSVTGFATGRSGFTSTMPKRPLASPGSG